MPHRVALDAMRRCDPARPVRDLDGIALGTGWRIRFAAATPVDDAALREAVDRRLADIVAEMSQWEATSLLSRFNWASAGSWFDLPSDFATVIAAALAIARQSAGAFDPTHGRAAALLGYGAMAVDRPPTPAELDDARARAGWEKLDFDPATRRLRQPGGLWLDLSGIAKGHAVDVVADLLAEQGIPDALVEIGGELVGRGLRPTAEPWWVDLESPPGAAAAALRLGLHDQAVATSGDYVRGAHTIDPRTGRPLATRTASVSVIQERAMLADAWATALTVMGAAQGVEIARRNRLAARWIERTVSGARETISQALAEMID